MSAQLRAPDSSAWSFAAYVAFNLISCTLKRKKMNPPNCIAISRTWQSITPAKAAQS
ncbi:conserved hypothetical protein [Ricinus communis]|uniref:Uncharacterized protein n=1 Tax=Ricinus communis TaxID=3988 RepID=B9RUT8_RICCO|nr:conserved hypothetical protein [Ricinus communis]